MAQIDNISKAEAVKQQSRQLRGHIARDLPDTANPFDKEGYALLKFHGIYQGYDRDSATELKQRGESKVWQFMVRVRIPGGRLTARPVSRPRRDRRELGRRLAANHDAAEHPIPRRRQIRPEGGDRRGQPVLADDIGRLRRCRAHGDDRAGADPRPGA